MARLPGRDVTEYVDIALRVTPELEAQLRAGFTHTGTVKLNLAYDPDGRSVLYIWLDPAPE